MLKPDQLEHQNHTAFRMAAADQKVCAVCEKPGSFDPHHVLYEKHLRAEGLPIYTTMNARRVCPLCHKQHHNARRRVKTIELTDDNIEYVFYALGIRAGDYLRRYYDDSSEDPRIVEHERDF